MRRSLACMSSCLPYRVLCQFGIALGNAHSMNLYYRTQGDGDPVIILHGLFGDGLNWGGVAKRLQTEYHLILPDMRNHGRSPHNDDDCSYPAMADDIVSLMGQLELESAHLIGHSMGGKAAMTLALQHPERVRSLTVVDIAPKSYPPRHEDVFTGLKAVAEARPASRQEADRLLAESITTDAIRTFILKNLVRGKTGFEWRLNWQALYTHYDQLTDFPVQEGHYDGPVQFLIGGASDYVADSDRERIEHLFPHAKGRIVGGSGHWLHAEKPEQTARWIKAFLDAAH